MTPDPPAGYTIVLGLSFPAARKGSSLVTFCPHCGWVLGAPNGLPERNPDEPGKSRLSKTTAFWCVECGEKVGEFRFKGPEVK